MQWRHPRYGGALPSCNASSLDMPPTAKMAHLQGYGRTSGPLTIRV